MIEWCIQNYTICYPKDENVLYGVVHSMKPTKVQYIIYYYSFDKAIDALFHFSGIDHHCVCTH